MRDDVAWIRRGLISSPPESGKFRGVEFLNVKFSQLNHTSEQSENLLSKLFFSYA